MNSPRLLCCLMFCSLPLQAADYRSDGVSSLLATQQRPEGVVFEILSWTDNSWDWAAPMLRQHVDQLRLAYPGLDIALVSQGVELFDLALRAGMQDTLALRQLARLSDEGVSIHVSGDYAKWKRLGVNDFLDFVDVVDSSAAQLQDYIELGFEHIRLQAPDAINR